MGSLRKEQVLTGEASPYYAFHPLSPRRIAELLPDVKLIFVLRDPVTRAHSHYHEEVARGFEPLTFEDALEAEPERLAGEVDRIRQDPSYVSFSHQHHSYLARGRYLDQLLIWHEVFSRDRVLVLEYEELVSNPDAVFRRALRFLELPDSSLRTYKRFNARSYPAMDSKLKARLRSYFGDGNRDLAKYVGGDFRWT
jgi:hypothetical protein